MSVKQGQECLCPRAVLRTIFKDPGKVPGILPDTQPVASLDDGGYYPLLSPPLTSFTPILFPGLEISSWGGCRL